MNADDQTSRQQLLSQAAIHASETVRTETYRAVNFTPLVLTIEQQAELRRQCEAISGQLQSLGVQMLRAWHPVVEAAITAAVEFHRALVEAGLVDDIEPTDLAARALHRRQHRNTGPRQQQRAPQRIDPRGCK